MKVEASRDHSPNTRHVTPIIWSGHFRGQGVQGQGGGVPALQRQRPVHDSIKPSRLTAALGLKIKLCLALLSTETYCSNPSLCWRPHVSDAFLLPNPLSTKVSSLIEYSNSWQKERKGCIGDCCAEVRLSHDTVGRAECCSGKHSTRDYSMVAHISVEVLSRVRWFARMDAKKCTFRAGNCFLCFRHWTIQLHRSQQTGRWCFVLMVCLQLHQILKSATKQSYLKQQQQNQVVIGNKHSPKDQWPSRTTSPQDCPAPRTLVQLRMKGRNHGMNHLPTGKFFWHEFCTFWELGNPCIPAPSIRGEFSLPTSSPIPRLHLTGQLMSKTVFSTFDACKVIGFSMPHLIRWGNHIRSLVEWLVPCKVCCTRSIRGETPKIRHMQAPPGTSASIPLKQFIAKFVYVVPCLGTSSQLWSRGTPELTFRETTKTKLARKQFETGRAMWWWGTFWVSC